MAVRRVVTGHTPEGKAVVVSDGEVAPLPVGQLGSTATLIWGRKDTAEFPDDGTQPQLTTVFPPVGGCICSVMELAPEGDDFHEFVRDAMQPWSDLNDAGMHRTATIDYDIVLEGEVVLELDDGMETTLGVGDIVVQNGTRHRWHNRGAGIARVMSVCIGAHHQIDGGEPV